MSGAAGRASPVATWASPARSACTRPPRAVALSVLSLLSLVLTALGTAVASADGGTANGHLTVAPPLVRSVSVDQGQFAYGGCREAGGITTATQRVNPNGRCDTPPLVLTVTGLASHVSVAASVMTPSDHGQVWS
jgi:hypothetical protein